MNLPAAIPALLAMACLGCARKAEDRVVLLPADIVVGKASSQNQRFLPTNTGDLAFDTKTGSLCKTWNWHEYDSYAAIDKQTIANQTQVCDHLYDSDVREAADEARSLAYETAAGKRERDKQR